LRYLRKTLKMSNVIKIHQAETELSHAGDGQIDRHDEANNRF